jgi:hypothetical protein
MPNDNSVIVALATHLARVEVAQGLSRRDVNFADVGLTFEAHETAQFEAALGRKLTADEWRTAADALLGEARRVLYRPRTPDSGRKPERVGEGKTDALEQV